MKQMWKCLGVKEYSQIQDLIFTFLGGFRKVHTLTVWASGGGIHLAVYDNLTIKPKAGIYNVKPKQTSSLYHPKY